MFDREGNCGRILSIPSRNLGNVALKCYNRLASQTSPSPTQIYLSLQTLDLISLFLKGSLPAMCNTSRTTRYGLIKGEDPHTVLDIHMLRSTRAPLINYDFVVPCTNEVP